LKCIKHETGKNIVKPKITMVVTGFPVTSQTFISLKVAELFNRGYDISIINLGETNDVKWAPDSLQAVIKKLPIISSKYYNSGKPYFRIGYLLPAILLHTFRYPFSSLRLLVHGALKRNFDDLKRIHDDALLLRATKDADIIHCQFASLATHLINFKNNGFLKANACIACSIRGADITWKNHIEKTDWDAVFDLFDLFLPVCNHFIPILRQMGCKKNIKVVHSPVNTMILNKIKPNTVKTSKTVDIISVGRLVEKKGFDDAIAAIYLLHKKTNNIRYKIIGDGPLHDYLKAKIRQYNLDNIIEMTGALPTNQTLEIMAGSDILLAPSKKASDGDSEGIPNVVKEAMVLCLQVVTTRHAGIPEIIEHGETGFLVPERSPEVLAGVLHDLIKDRTGWDSRAQKAKAFALYMFSVEKTTDELIEAYNQILDIEFSR